MKDEVEILNKMGLRGKDKLYKIKRGAKYLVAVE